MLNRIMARWLMPALLLVVAVPSFAQTLYPKRDNLFWVRNGVAVNLANGVRNNVAGVAPDATTRDTSGVIDVRDHWTALKRVQVSNPNIVLATALTQDTLQIFGTLTLTSSRWSLDSLRIVRQWSSDGVRWNTVDSLGRSCVAADTAWHQSTDVSDTLVSAVTSPTVVLRNGIAQRVINYSWPCNPWFFPESVTAKAANGVNYIRFIITMTNGDFVAAGLNEGWTGTFNYLAFKP